MQVAWQNQFEEAVLTEGFRHYQDGNVTGLKKTSTGFEAQIVDGQIQKVSMMVKNGVVEALQCSCQVAKGNQKCPHQVATLLTLDEMLPRPLVFEVSDGHATVTLTIELEVNEYRQILEMAQHYEKSLETFVKEVLKAAC